MSKVVKIVGKAAAKLNDVGLAAVNKYIQNGAVKKVGEIESVEIKTRGDENPVHKSHFNRNDTEDVLSVRITPVDKTKKTLTHHVYMDGTGTFKKGDKREFSSTAGRRQ
ncbi:hypothetical protein HBH53_120330 [Parastagonospora nodorum]|nr:hypothetical protein HBH53_120330 [Parastagonospora nodorum]KAH4097529.1 hypothetical protein HBH46_159270 [Parastagonospora nodorum]KAH4186749.1 hypothetical protein HBI95_238440 [Parastagonospora nodorum]KAH4189927.1 hypothetical protein HBH42_137750 [Parastagonospora nodorum]KAH4850157.1 hypothetical protein HBH75_138050 [Parastagonospora nodorum]